MTPRARATRSASPIIAEYFVGTQLYCETQYLRDAFVYWQGKSRPGRLPGRQDIDPLEIPYLLPHLMLVDVEQGPESRRFRFRLMGEHHVTIVGTNATGRYFDEIWQVASDEGEIAVRYEAVCARRQPHYWKRAFVDPYKDWRFYERVAMPLASDGETVDMVLAALVPFPSR